MATSTRRDRTVTFSADLGERVFDWIMKRGWISCAVGVYVISLVKYGVGLYPGWNWMRSLAINWRAPHLSPYLQPPDDFRLQNPVAAVVAGWLHLTGPSAYLAFTFVLASAALIAPLAMPAARRDNHLRITICVLILGSAIPAILLSWVGGYDAVIVGAAGVAGLARRRETLVLAWLLMALDNAPQAAIALVVYSIVLFVDQQWAAVQRIVASAVGWLAGYVVITVAIHDWGGATSQIHLYFHFYGPRRFVDHALDYWPLIAVSVLGVGWLLIASRPALSVRAIRGFLLISIAIAVVLPFFILDETRVISGALWAPLLLAGSILISRSSPSEIERLLKRLLPVAALAVIVIAWDGNLVYAGWRSGWQFFAYVFQH